VQVFSKPKHVLKLYEQVEMHTKILAEHPEGKTALGKEGVD
jgi:hypothetical protein